MRGRVRLRSAGAPGRVRLAADGLRRRPEVERSVAARLGRLPGVHRAEPSALTGNVLLEFQPERWTPRSLLLASGRARGIKDYKSLRCRTLFGELALTSPRLRHCRCEAHQQASFSPLLALLPERTAPELRYLNRERATTFRAGYPTFALDGQAVRVEELSAAA